MFTWWIDYRFLLQRFDMENRWIWTRIDYHLVLQANRVTKCASHPKMKRSSKSYSELLSSQFRVVQEQFRRRSENMQQIYWRTPMPKCDFNKVAKQLYWNHTLQLYWNHTLLHTFRTPFIKNSDCGCFCTFFDSSQWQKVLDTLGHLWLLNARFIVLKNFLSWI